MEWFIQQNQVVQAAIVTGIFGVITAIITGAFNLIKSQWSRQSKGYCQELCAKSVCRLRLNEVSQQ